MTSNDWVALLTIIGGLIIFASWIFENYFQRKWQVQKQESDYIRELLISGDLNIAIIKNEMKWFDYLFSVKKELPMKKYVISSHYAFVKHSIDMEFLTAKILLLDSKNFTKENYKEAEDKRYKEAEELDNKVKKEEDYDWLIKTAMNWYIKENDALLKVNR